MLGYIHGYSGVHRDYDAQIRLTLPIALKFDVSVMLKFAWCLNVRISCGGVDLQVTEQVPGSPVSPLSMLLRLSHAERGTCKHRMCNVGGIVLNPEMVQNLIQLFDPLKVFLEL